MASEPSIDPPRPAVPVKRPLSWLGRSLILANLGVLIFVTWAWLRLGSIPAGLAYVKGERLFADSTTKVLAPLAPGELKKVTFRLSNVSGVPINVLGAKSSCSCTAAGDLPMTIPARSTLPFEVGVHAGPKAEVLEGTLKLFTDHPGTPALILRVSAMIDGATTASQVHAD